MGEERKEMIILSSKLEVKHVDDICQVLRDGLASNFQDVLVEEVECPDLSQAPWNLAAPGIRGQPMLLDVGGVPYLIPTPDLRRAYNFDALAGLIGRRNAFFIGPGCGATMDGVNAELMASVKVGEVELNKSVVATIGEDGACKLNAFPHKDFSLLGNFLVSDGRPGKVIKVRAARRTGEENFVSCMRHALKRKWASECVGLGGAFLIKKGKAKLHVMPDFSSTPLLTDEAVNDWLKFYEMSAPLVCLSVLISNDPGLDLRLEHTHCFSSHGEGGHYHYDVTPDVIEYEGYFVMAESVGHVDPPEKTHSVGRD